MSVGSHYSGVTWEGKGGVGRGKRMIQKKKKRYKCS